MVKLNLGCGKKKIPGFVNVDIRPEVEPDLVADVTDLKKHFPDGVDLIYSCHNLEHVKKNAIWSTLTDWRAILKPDGVLYISVPDFQACAEHYMVFKDVKVLQGLLVGGGKNDYDYHFMVFDFEYLKNCLISARFRNVERYDRWQTDWGYVDDYSAATLNPPFSREGKLMSLNVRATK